MDDFKCGFLENNIWKFIDHNQQVMITSPLDEWNFSNLAKEKSKDSVFVWGIFKSNVSNGDEIISFPIALFYKGHKFNG